MSDLPTVQVIDSCVVAEQREEGGPPGEGRRSKRGRPKGGGKKRTWESYGVRETRGRSQRLANTQVAPSVDVQVSPSVSALEGASGSEIISSTAVEAHIPVAPRVLGIVTGVRETLPTEGSVSSGMINSPLDDYVVNVKTEVTAMDKHETLRPEGATSAETACSLPAGTAIDDQQRHLAGDDETTDA